MKKKWALFSVYDKTGILELAKTLAAFDIGLLATSGTAKLLSEAGLDVVEVARHTGFPEMMEGRVKTLHPKIHGGILARRDDPMHLKAMEEHKIDAIDFLILNFYPFSKTIATSDSEKECIEQIDIGAPAMVRGGAKNFEFVSVIVAAEDYQKLADEVKQNKGTTSLAFRKKYAQKAFATTSFYDSQIANWLAQKTDSDDNAPFVLGGTNKQALRYGENPHQTAALYQKENAFGIANAKQIQGKALSYNNLADSHAAWALVQSFASTQNVAAIIKHANPCGAALGDTLFEAYNKAFNADSLSAFGGIVAVNQTLTKPLAEKMIEIFTECVIAPDIEEGVADIFARKKNLRLLIAKPKPKPQLQVQVISGGFLVQQEDRGTIDELKFKSIGAREPSLQEQADMVFAWNICKFVKSNAIVLAENGATCGIGAGQTSRLDSARIAINKLSQKSSAKEGGNWVAASDAFFPFTDGVELLHKAGIKAIIHPGGSMRDKEVEEYAKQNNIAMWITAMRHFKH